MKRFLVKVKKKKLKKRNIYQQILKDQQRRIKINKRVGKINKKFLMTKRT